MAPVQSKPVSEVSTSRRRSGKSQPKPKPAAATPRKRGGRQPGATNFGGDEMLTAIELVSLLNPTGNDAWVNLAERHNEIHPTPKRDWKLLKKKWEAVSRYLAAQNKKITNLLPGVE